MKTATIKQSLVPLLECVHADTCLPDYWGGHHLAHVSIPIYGSMSLHDIKTAIHSELNEGAVAGSDERTIDGSGDIGDAWFYRAHAAVNRIKPNQKGKRRFFTDVPIDEDADYSVYAYFVFREV